MPAKKLKQPKQIREKLPATAVGKVRTTHYEPVDGKRNVVSQIPVVKRRGRPSLSAKFDPTVDINDALKRLGKGFFVGEEKDLFKTPLKVKPTAGLSSPPSQSNKRGAGRSGSRSRGSPGSTTSSQDSPYFLRSKGAADEVVDDSSLRQKRRQKSVGLDSAEKESPARKMKLVDLDSAERKTPAGKRKSDGLDSAERKTPGRKRKSGGLGSAEKESQGRKTKSVAKESPARRGRKSTQSPPRKKTEVEKPESLVKGARKKDDIQESSVRDKERVKSVKKDAAKTAAAAGSRRQTKASVDVTSEENADEVVRVETGKKRKRDVEDEVDDPKTKRAKIVLVDSAKIREVVQEPNEKPATTMRLMVHRANVDNLVDKMILDSDNEQSLHGRVEGTKSVANKSKTPSSAFKEVSQTKKEQSRTTTEVTTVATSSRNRSSVFGSVNNNALSDSVQRLREAAARNLDEAARQQPHDLTANIFVRDSWSAHLYDKGSASASKTMPQASAAGNSQRRSMDALRPLSVVMPSVDFQMKWDTSAVKEQLLNSVLPQTPRKDKLETISLVLTGKDANSRPHGKGLLESDAVISAISSATPLKRSVVDKSIVESDVVELGEGIRLRTTRKTVHTEEEIETSRRPSPGRYSAVPFNMALQPLRGNGAGMRHSVDRMLSPIATAVDRVDAIRGRSVEPGMIRGESVVRMRPKFNGQLVAKEQTPVVEMRRERCGSVCRRLLCVAGTSVLVVGALWLVQLAMAAGYLGEFF